MAMTRAGAVALLLEAVPPEVSQRIVEKVGIPVIAAALARHATRTWSSCKTCSARRPSAPVRAAVPDGSLIEMAGHYVNQVRSGAYPTRRIATTCRTTRGVVHRARARWFKHGLKRNSEYHS
jgi:hypothetical protein